MLRALALGLGAALLFALAFAFRGPLLHLLVLGGNRARGQGLLGALLGFAGIIAVTLLFLPLVPLLFLSGWVWGAWGAPLALAAATVSAMSSFSIARALGRSAVAQGLQRSPRAAKVFALAEQGGPATVALLRVAPIIPFTPGNALLGLTRLRLRDMAIGTPLGLLPGAIFDVWMGALLPDAQSIERGDALHLLTDRGWLFAALIAAHVAAVAVAALIARTLHGRRSTDQL